MTQTAELGVIGGSGLYALLEDPDEVEIETPFGSTSAVVTIGELGGCQTAFIPRHGGHHELAPHLVPYRANLWALRELGVRRVIAPAASGSLQPDIRPGDIVICDQLVDRTSGRADTYSEAGYVIHVSMADPYCASMRALGCDAAQGLGLRVHETGTVVVIQGPRFSTRAESRWFASAGWSVVNMTQYPEATLARELGLCYLNLSVVTDNDAGVPGERAVDARSVMEVLREGMGDAKRLIEAIASRLADLKSCECAAMAAEGRI